MEAMMQRGGPSPKENSAVMSSSQSKPGLDNLQNSATSSPSQTKGKKREHGDQCSDPVKRERSSKTDYNDSGSVKNENMWRSEAAKLTEKGCLVGSESVEKLVQFIQPNRMDKKLDLVSRSMVAGVIAATDWFDCLSHFVQLKGLAVLDEWLQDVHKGRIGDVSGLKDGEKSVEEFIMVLLRALDKLPVNLHALQTCNIGRSVNRLRSHRNSDIQRKARNLVDIWKKRVEAEMNVLDAKSGSNQVATWSSKSNLPEVHGSRNSAGSYDVSLKCSVTQDSGSNSKTVLNKGSTEETTTMSICSSSGTVKAPTLSPSEKEARMFRLSGWDDKNNSSALSNNSSHSFPGQEEMRITTSGVMNANKSSSGSSRHRKSTSGLVGTTGSNKETLGRNNSINRNVADGKLMPSSPSCERTFEVPVVETSSHKLIVKIPNRFEPSHCSPAQSASGASFDDHSATSPVLSNIVESDHSLKDKSDLHPNNMAPDANVEPWHDDDHKDLQIAQNKNVDGNSKASEKSVVPCSSLENDVKAKRFLESSTSALNTLIESCVKYSESNAPTTSAGDDVGMNLLASVATREMCADSMHGSTFQGEKNCLGNDSKSNSGDNHVTNRCPMNSESEKQINSAAVLGFKEGIPLSKQVSMESPSALSEEALKVNEDYTEMNGRHDQIIRSKGVLHNMKESKLSEDNEIRDTSQLDDVSGVKATGTESSLTEVKRSDVLSNAGNIRQQDEITPSSLLDEAHHKKEFDANSNSDAYVEAKSRSSLSLLVNESPTVPSQDVDGRGILKRQKLCVTERDKMEETKSAVADGASSSAFGQLDMVSRMDFDLNEGFSGLDGKCGELEFSVGLSTANDVRTPVSLGCMSVPAAITVAAAAKGPFVPPVDLLRNKGELGWKGSASTSAFRPVEPRKVTQMIAAHSNVSILEDSTSKPSRVRLDFDLNVADERLLEDMGCQDSSMDNVKNHDNLRNKVSGPLPISHSGGLDLDLNRVDDTNVMLQYSTSSNYKLSAPVIPTKSLLSSSLSTNEVKRDFDLNSGPGFDDVVGEQSSLTQLGGGGTLSMNSLSPVFGVRPSGHEARNFSAWLPSGNPYSSVVIPSVLPDRGEHPFSVVVPMAPQRILGPSSGGPFTPDMYRGSLLSPSQAVPFPPGPYPYQMFPFGTTLPMPSGTFSVGSASTSSGRLFNPALNSQFLAPVSELSSQYPKKYLIGMHEGSDNGGLENNRKWSRQNFDLNAGPGVPEVEGREDFLAQRQLYISGSQPVAEEQGRIYPTADNVLKRKEPEAGLDRENFRYKQSSWH